MIVYILAIPVFSFLIPIYAFWHFDDFSWGNTRIVVGDKGQKKAVGPEEGKFDPDSIPTKCWSEHEQEMLEEWQESQSNCSKNSRESDYSCEKEQHTHCSSHLTASASSSMHSHLEGDITESIYSHGNTATNPPYSMQMDRGGLSVHDYYSTAPEPSYFQGPNFSRAPSTHSFFAMPNDEVISQEIERILDNHDLRRLTKKQVRDTLSDIFGMDMTCKKEYINRCIDQFLSARFS
jgi:chitin synthase